MARILNDRPGIPGQHVNGNSPIDDRCRTKKQIDLIKSEEWMDGGVDVRYSGMQVVVYDDDSNNGVYWLKDRLKANKQSWDSDETETYHADGWRRVGNVNADWNASSGPELILNKPDLSDVALSGNYDDLTNKPVIPDLPDNLEDQLEELSTLVGGDEQYTDNLNDKKAFCRTFGSNTTEYIWHCKGGTPLYDDGVTPRVNRYITDYVKNGEIQYQYWANATRNIECKVVQLKANKTSNSKILITGNRPLHIAFLTKPNLRYGLVETDPEKCMVSFAKNAPVKNRFIPNLAQLDTIEYDGTNYKYIDVPRLANDETNLYLYIQIHRAGNGADDSLNANYYELYTVKNTSVVDVLHQVEERLNDVEVVNYSVENNDTYFNDVITTRTFADNAGNTLLPLTFELESDGYETIKTVQQQNIINKAKAYAYVKWTSKESVPYYNNISSGVHISDPFSQNSVHYGLPYSSVKECDKFVGINVSLHTFMTAANNPYSLLYTEDVNRATSKSAWGFQYHGTNCAAYYGTVCSEFTSFCVGYPISYSTTAHNWLSKYTGKMVQLDWQDDNNIQVGDILYRRQADDTSGHCLVVVGVKRDSSDDYNVTKLMVADTLGKGVKIEEKNGISAIGSGFAKITAHRSLELYKNIGFESTFAGDYSEFIDVTNLSSLLYSTEPDSADLTTLDLAQESFSYNDRICTFAGDKACFAEGDLVVLNYDLDGAEDFALEEIRVYQDDDVDPYMTISSTDIDNMIIREVSQKNHAAVLGIELPPGKYSAEIDFTDSLNATTTTSAKTKWEVIDTSHVNITAKTKVIGTKDGSDYSGMTEITFSSTNGTPVALFLKDKTGSGIAYRELTPEEIEKRQINTNLFKLAKQQSGTRLSDALDNDDVVTFGIYFKGDYGMVASKTQFNPFEEDPEDVGTQDQGTVE